MVKRLLLTGICGFIGHHFVEHILKNTDWEIVGFDMLDYASFGFSRLRDIKAYDDTRVKIFSLDFTNPIPEGVLSEVGHIDYIVHMGAQTHVDNSIVNPLLFAHHNTIGTIHMLEFAKKIGVEKFLFFNTDECFGPALHGKTFYEGDAHNPSNPYAASKSAAEQFCVSYANTYKMPIMITHTMNVIGERQHPEKFIPMVINKVISGETIKIHSDATKTISGSRFWIHGRTVSDALVFLLKNVDEYLDIEYIKKGRFNIAGEKEVSNLEIAQNIASIIGKPLHYEMVDFHSSRPGHDLRYALCSEKIYKLGWKMPMSLEASLRKMVEWTLLPENEKWLKV
jgi:dTDP-glucose 4,6-dehydratase